MSQEHPYDVVVIGGGVVGCGVARELSRYRLRTALLERNAEVGFGTSKSNSGIIHPGHHSPPRMLKSRLAVKGNAMFDRLREELDFGFKRIGEVVVAKNEKELAVLHRLQNDGEALGVKGLELWDRQKLLRMEPNLSTKLVGALHAPSAGVVNPYELVFGLVNNAVRNGVELLVDAEVAGLASGDDQLTIRLSDGRTLRSRFVVNCAGVFADAIAAMLRPVGFSIHPRKGEEYMLDRRLEGVVRRLVFPVPTPTSKGILIIPTFDGTIMVGPTAFDTDQRDDWRTTTQGAGEIFKVVGGICPGITQKDTIAEFAGLRAVSDTDDFIIEPSSTKGFINVAGTQSPGLTASPAIAEYVVALLKSEGLQLAEKDDFQPREPGPIRFARLSTEEQIRLAAANPGFSKIVCRCETVTEAEIHHAIDLGAKTLDGIKFRTRAGMGRCQGAFCSVRCMRILSERLGVPMEAITKRGGKSWIVSKIQE